MSRRDIQRTSRIPLVVNFKVAVSSLPSIFIAKFSAPGKSRCDQLAQATLYNREVNGTRRRSEGRKKGEGDNGVKERKKERERRDGGGERDRGSKRRVKRTRGASECRARGTRRRKREGNERGWGRRSTRWFTVYAGAVAEVGESSGGGRGGG